jgi:hypothetical protein
MRATPAIHDGSDVVQHHARERRRAERREQEREQSAYRRADHRHAFDARGVEQLEHVLCAWSGGSARLRSRSERRARTSSAQNPRERAGRGRQFEVLEFRVSPCN